MEFIQAVIFAAVFLAMIGVPILLICWELATSQRKQVDKKRHRQRAAFWSVLAAGLLAAVYSQHLLPLLIVFVISLFTSLCLLGLFLSFVWEEIRGSRSPREILCEEEGGDVNWPRVAAAVDASRNDFHDPSLGNSNSERQKKPRWWTRRFPRIRLGRYGIWN